MSIPDEELVAQYRRGNEASLFELIRRSTPHAHSLVRVYIKSNDEAEDVTQEAIMKAWKHLRRFDTNKKWKTWLLTIARNTALDHLKRKRAATFSEIEGVDPDEFIEEMIEDTEPLASELLERRENIEQLKHATESLRPEHNTVLMLHYYEELTFQEISEVMDLPLNTVKSWHLRALQRLKKLLAAPK